MISSFSISGNWIDFIIIVILLYFVSEAWKYGFWIVLADFLGFLVSLVIALFGYSYVSEILQSSFSLPVSISKAIGFMIVAGLSQGVLGFFLSSLVKKIPYRFWKKPWNEIAGTFPAIGQGLVLLSFFLTLIISLPLSPAIKKAATDSKIGGFLIKNTSGVEAGLNEVFGGLVEDSLTYLIVKPGSTEPVPIVAEKENLKVDFAAENEMLKLVNQERKKRGIDELSLRTELLPVARSHANDMWVRGYFGHVSPEGENVGDRLEKEGLDYQMAGENLALAPTVETAHTGLMNSEGHRENILDPDFKRVGIGVIDNGVYGKMFVQVFTD